MQKKLKNKDEIEKLVQLLQYNIIEEWNSRGKYLIFYDSGQTTPPSEILVLLTIQRIEPRVKSTATATGMPLADC